MNDTPHGASELPRARVMFFERGGSGGDVSDGTWETLPWGLGDDWCCALTLESGQSLHIWLEGLTDRPAETPCCLEAKGDEAA